MLLSVMVTGSGNSLLVKPSAGEMSLGQGWKLDVKVAEKRLLPMVGII